MILIRVKAVAFVGVDFRMASIASDWNQGLPNTKSRSRWAGSFHCGNEGSIRPLATSPEQRVALETPLLAAWLWEATN